MNINILEGVTQDEWGCVLNTPETYKQLAKLIFNGHPVFFAWTEQEGTQLDILMVYGCVTYGRPQRGIKAGADLMVGIVGFGVHGFAINTNYLAPGYVAEKFNRIGVNVTTEKLTDLIYGVKTALAKGDFDE